MLAGLRQEKAGDLDGAIQSYSEAIRTIPDIAELYVARGRLWLRKNDLDRAIADLSRAIELNPRDGYAYQQRGEARVAKRDDGGAVLDFSEAIRLDESIAFLLLYRADALTRLAQYDRADADLTRYITLRPTDPEGYSKRGLLRLYGRENHRSTFDFDEALRLDPKLTSAYLGRSRARRNMKEYDRAIADADEAIRLAPTRPHGHFERAETHMARRNWVQAVSDYSEAVRIDPAYAPGYNMRAWVLATCPDASVRNGELAVADARRACELTRWENADYLDTLAAAEAECGRFDEAARSETRALENADYAKSPQAAGARNRLKIYQEGKAYREGAAPEVPAAVRGHEPSPEQAVAGTIFKVGVGAVVLLMVAWRLHRHGVFPFRRPDGLAPSFEVVAEPSATDTLPAEPAPGDNERPPPAQG